MTDELERWRSAYHEAGHLVVGLFLLGDVPEVLTIRPAEGYAAACIGSTFTIPGLAEHRPGLPAALIDPALRARTELAIIVLLAGVAAGRLAPRPAEGYIPAEPADDRERAAALAKGLAELSPRAAELLAHAERLPATEDGSDGAVATGIAMNLVGQEGASMVYWLESSATRFVDCLAGPVGAVATELVARTVLSGAAAEAITDGWIAAHSAGTHDLAAPPASDNGSPAFVAKE